MHLAETSASKVNPGVAPRFVSNCRAEAHEFGRVAVSRGRGWLYCWRRRATDRAAHEAASQVTATHRCQHADEFQIVDTRRRISDGWLVLRRPLCSRSKRRDGD